MNRIKRSNIKLEADNDFFLDDEPMTAILYDVHDNGQVCYEKQIINSLLDGPYRAWYKDGTLKEEGLYQKNKKEGVWKSYYPTGELHIKEIFISSLIAEKKIWSEDGNFIEEQKTELNNGGKTSKTEIKRWDIAGNLIERTVAEYGIILSKETWDALGKLITSYHFQNFDYNMLYLI